MHNISKLFLLLFVFTTIIFGILKIFFGVLPTLAFFIFLVLIATYFIGLIISERKLLLEFFTMKTTKSGMNMGVQILLVLGVLFFVNKIAMDFKLSKDITKEGLYSLSPQSEKIAKSIDQDLSVLYFYQRGLPDIENLKTGINDLVNKYSFINPKIKLTFVEVNERPDLVEKYQVRNGSGVAYLSYKEKKVQVETPSSMNPLGPTPTISEQQFTKSLREVSTQKKTKIYFLSGHGEKDPNQTSDPYGLGTLKSILEQNQIGVADLNLSMVSKIPEDADALVIIGPEHELLDGEKKLILEFTQKGKSLMIAFDQNKPHRMDEFIKEFGVSSLNNFVLSPLSKLVGSPATPVQKFSQLNSATRVLAETRSMALLYLPTALKKMDTAPSGLKIEELVGVGEESMAFSTVPPSGPGQPGPFSMIMEVSGNFGTGKDKTSEPDEKSNSKSSRIIISGDSDFFTNQLINQGLNSDLARNLLGYLVADEDVVSIAPKQPGVSQTQITETGWQLFVFTFILPMPIILFALALFLWFKRRHA